MEKLNDENKQADVLMKLMEEDNMNGAEPVK